MAKAEEVVHKKIVEGLADTRVSPAVLARMMQDENLYVNESFLHYFINYVVQLANTTHVPLYLEEVQQQCKLLYSSLQELGLTGTVGREPVDKTEFLAV